MVLSSLSSKETTNGGALMEQSGRNRWRPMANGDGPGNGTTSLTVAVGCVWLRIGSHGKEGVDGSSPSKGLPKVPANRGFL